MAQQTAVEQLYERLERMIPRTEMYNRDKIIYLNQAKEMEKQQIMNAFDIRKVDIAFDKKTTSEDYYTETYKSE
jgi:hypothetical protein